MIHFPNLDAFEVTIVIKVLIVFTFRPYGSYIFKKNVGIYSVPKRRNLILGLIFLEKNYFSDLGCNSTINSTHSRLQKFDTASDWIVVLNQIFNMLY